MTDTQFQPGQPIPPTQWSGVFGGQAEEIQQPVSPIPEKTTQQTLQSAPFGWVAVEEDVLPSSPFEGFILPQETPTEQAIPVVEPIVEPVREPEIILSQNTPVVEEIHQEKTPLVEEIHQEETPVVEEIVEEETIEEEPAQQPVSDIQQKFNELTENISDLTSLLKLKDGEVLEIVWANNDKVSLLYQFGINEQHEVHVKRIETDKSDDETTFNELTLGINSESKLLEVFVDEVLLFQEDDLLEDTKKKSQVMDKLNKFIFLTESKLKDVQKELSAKQEEEEERRRLQDIFRNF